MEKKQFSKLDMQGLAVINTAINPMTTSQRLTLNIATLTDGYMVTDTDLGEIYIVENSAWKFTGGTSSFTAIDQTAVIDIEAQIVLKESNELSIFADGEAGKRDIERRLKFENTIENSKINWYFFAPTGLTLSQIKSLYFTAQKSGLRMPYIFVYTKATGTGDLGGYYKSRVTYEMATNTTAGFSEFYALTDPNVEYGVTGFNLTKNFGNQDLLTGNEDNEEILYIGLGTDSAADIGDYNFSLQEFGIELVNGTRRNMIFNEENAPSLLIEETIKASQTGGDLTKHFLLYKTTESISVPNSIVYKQLINGSTFTETDKIVISKTNIVEGQQGVATFSSSDVLLASNSVGTAGNYLYYGWDASNSIYAITETKPTIGKFWKLGKVIEDSINVNGIGGHVRISFEPELLEQDGNTLIFHQTGTTYPLASDLPTGAVVVSNINGLASGGTPQKLKIKTPQSTFYDATQRSTYYANDTWGGRPSNDIVREGDVFEIIINSITYRKATYQGGAWVIDKGIFPYLLDLDYPKGSIVLKDNFFYSNNEAIAANTAFLEGITGETWKKIPSSTLRNEITQISNGGSNGLLFVAGGRLYTARGQEGNGAWVTAQYDAGRISNFNNGIRNAYEIVIPDMGTATVVDASAINTMAYALLSDGRLYTWGNNPYGNLGLGNLTAKYLPTLSKTGVAKVFKHHSQEQRSFDYVRMFIQDTGGKVWCAGYNGQGQLGVGSGASLSSWTEVTAAGLNPKSVWVMGSYIGFTMIQKADGNVLVAGYTRGGGGLGISSGAADIQAFTNANVWIGNDLSYTIKQVEAGLGFNDTNPNDRMNMAVLSDNGTSSRLLSCGDNSWGTIGNGTTTGNNILTPTAPTGLTARIKKIVRMGDAPGSMHALDYDGNLWSWGRGGQGVLGRTITTDNGTPAIATTGVIDIFQLSASPQWGYETTSPIVQKADGYYSSGWNGIGLVGNASLTQVNTYVKMLIPSNVTIKYVGQFSTNVNKFTRVAVTTDNKIYGWGYGANFNIDGVTTANALMPMDLTPNCLNK